MQQLYRRIRKMFTNSSHFPQLITFILHFLHVLHYSFFLSSTVIYTYSLSFPLADFSHKSKKRKPKHYILTFSSCSATIYIIIPLLINQILHTLQSDHQGGCIMKKGRSCRLDHSGNTEGDQTCIDHNDRTVVLVDSFHQSVTNCF